jgi:hypothetical protein
MKLIISVLLISLCYYSLAQTKGKRGLSLEILGRAGYGSFNYEHRIFPFNKWSIWGSVGMSTVRLFDTKRTFNPDVLIPFGFFITTNKKHGIEANIGTTFSSIPKALDNERNNNLSLNTGIGYRYDFERTPFYIAGSYQFILVHFTTIRHWGGMRIGYTF